MARPMAVADRHCSSVPCGTVKWAVLLIHRRVYALELPPSSGMPWRTRWLLSNDLDENALSAAAIELAVKDLFPRAEIETAFGDRDHNLAPHDLTL